MITESMNISKKRDPFIDSLKGVAIILVVIGHVVGTMLGEDQATQNVLFRICYSFHMPLFMTISGFLTGGTTKDFKWLRKRALRLLLPWVIWTTVFCIVRFDGWYGFIDYFFIEPAIWFLPCLFLCNTYLVLLNYTKTKKVIIAITVYFAVSIIGVILGIRMIKDFTIFLPFYMLGYIYKIKISDFLKSRQKILILLICTVIYPVSMLFYTFGTSEAAERAEKTVEKIGFGNDLIFKAAYWFNSRFIIACLGMVACVAIFKILYRYARVVLNPFAFIGQHTMAIYILSEYFYFNLLNEINNNFVTFLLGTLICITAPLAISVILKKYAPKYHRILFG